MTTQSQQQQMAQQQQARATTVTEHGAGIQDGATDSHEEFCGGACGAGAGAAVIWRPITVESRRR
ncbi:hypothetical protein AZL_e02280 (plasmid) [Azospirillum sp. B510]|uniref:hypothetical protein n=1 Tax=Azospirillum sp. (strain B510) TaxID=137722 RepID=UPI0001C4CE75|nr:hypothetical protein [Azospirillum sp. B510]BAI76573.1 hypothetical protein AZL_e02280 [Azospirillum sp. B510]